MNLFTRLIQPLAARIVEAAGAVPTQRAVYLGPRFEPPNISNNATVAQVQTALREAESGDPTSLFRFYRDSVLGDDHVQGCLNTRKLAVLGQPLAVMPADKGSAEDLAAAAAVRRAIADCENWTDGLAACLDSAFWPVSVLEKIYTPGGAPSDGEPRLQWTLRRLEPVNPLLLCYRWAYFTGGVGLGTATPIQTAGLNPKGQIGSGSAYQVDLTRWEPWIKLWPIDESGRILYDASRAGYLEEPRHLVHRGHLLTAFRDNWGGPGRAVLAWWLLRGLGRDWFGRFMERYGMPFPKGRTNVQDPQAVQLLQEAFSMATKIGGIVIGQDDEVELVQAMIQGGAEGHRLWHEVCNNAISRHITGVEASAAPAGLNAGQSKKSENVREDVRMFDQIRLVDTLERQWVQPFLRMNGLSGRVKLSFGGLSDEDAARFAGTLKTLSEAGWEPTDEALPTINDRLGIPVQRKAAAPALDPGLDPAGLAVFSARSPQVRRPNPSDAAVAHRRAALTAAYRGSMAPFREAILASTSREDCLARLQTLYADWSPDRLSSELETALQIAAAAGAAAATHPPKTP